MNPGYMSLWILTIVLILIATGWSDWVGSAAPSRLKIWIIAAGCFVLQPLQHTVAAGAIGMEVHASAVYIMLAALAAVRGRSFVNSKIYLLLCALLAGMIWGSIQKMYGADPVFFWIDPRWDAPLLGGLLAAAFSTKAQHQFAVLIFTSVFAELVNAVLSGGRYTAHIGAFSWWDGFWLAFAFARAISVAFSAVRFLFEKHAVLLWKNRRTDAE